MDLIDLNRCRVCLSNEKQMYSLYEPIKDIDNVSNIAELLEFCCDLQVSNCDRKPQNICENCKELAKNLSKFKINCKLTDIKLNCELIIATTKCKQEEVEEFTAEEEVVQLHDDRTEDKKDLICNFYDGEDILMKKENETDTGQPLLKKAKDQTSEDNFCSKAGYSSQNIVDDNETEENCQIGSKRKRYEMCCKSAKVIWPESSDCEMDEYILPDLKEFTNKVVENSIPVKSKARYEQAYKVYKEWCSITPTERNISTENVVLAYFMDLGKTKKPSTLWATYSMVKTTLNINENVDISKFSKLLAYLKTKNVEYTPKKSGIFSKNDIDTFLKDAPLEFLPQKDDTTEKKNEHPGTYLDLLTEDLCTLCVQRVELKKNENFLIKQHFMNNEENYFPLTGCLGVYTPNHLWEHKNICKLEDDSKNINTRGVLAESQTFITRRDLPGNYLDSSTAANLTFTNELPKSKLLSLSEAAITFKKYIDTVIDNAFRRLQHDKEVDFEKYFKILLECILTELLILNRRKIREIQFLDINTYTNKSSTLPDKNLQTLTEFEKKMIKSFKKVDVFGKHPSHVLFTKQLGKLIDFSLEIRKRKNIIPESNKYIFALPGSADGYMNATLVLRKWIFKSDAKIPELLTNVRFRTEASVIFQLLSFQKKEMEKVAQFMGHKKTTYKEFDRLSENVEKISKVAKVIILLNAGKGDDYKGKSLEDIDRTEENLESKDEEIDVFKTCRVSPRINEKSKKGNRKRWTAEEKQKVIDYFKDHIEDNVVPRKMECLVFIENNGSIFKKEDWAKIKTFVYNSYRNK